MAYGVNAPFGLQPRRMLSGATWNGQTNEYTIVSGYTQSLFTGDPVTLLGTGGIGIGVGGTVITAQTPIVGVFQGCKYLLNNVEVFSPYWRTGTTPDNGSNATALVVDDPNVVYDIQVSTSAAPDGNIITGKSGIVLSDLNLNANFNQGRTADWTINPLNYPQNPTAGSFLTGQSAYYLDILTANPGTDVTLNLKILALTPSPSPQNVFWVTGTYAAGPPVVYTAPVGTFNNAMVIINNHIFKGGTGTAGI